MNRSLRTLCLLAVVVTGLPLLAACSTQMGYNRAYVEYTADKLPVLFMGKVCIVTSPEADATVTSKAPSSFQGGGHESVFQSGVFVRDTALLTFSRAFRSGGEHRSSLSDVIDSKSSVIIEPRMVSFDHKNTLSGSLLNGTMQHTARAVVGVRFRLNDGSIIDREYDSGYVAFEANSGFGGETNADDNSFGSAKKRRIARGELNFAHAFAVAFQLALKDMESFMPKDALIQSN